MVPSIRQGKIPGPEDPSRQLRFGLIADVQYANIPDGKSFNGTNRYYRNAMAGLKMACDAWRGHGVACIMQLGDVIDGFQKSKAEDSSENALSSLMELFDGVGVPSYATLGNHELYNLPRDRLNQMLRIPSTQEGNSYYSITPHPAWKMIVLDTYDISLIGRAQDHPKTKQAKAILAERNPNENPNSPEGLEGVARRFVGFGGGLGDEQLGWLREQLREAEASGQHAMIFGHNPMHPKTCANACLLWDFPQALDVLAEYAGTVVATFAGHAHRNGYFCDEQGVHHIVLPSVVETKPGEQSFGVCDCYDDCVVIRGAGAVESRTLMVPAPRNGHASMDVEPVEAEAATVSVNA